MILDEVLEATESQHGNFIEINTKENAKKVIGQMFWWWFNKNLNRKLTTIKLFGIFKKSIYVRDLKDIFTLLFGPQNGLSEGSQT